MLQTLPSRVAPPAGAASPTTGAYKVDISRGERIGRVSSEWFSRPDDERYLSLGALHAAVRGRAERATARNVETKALRVEANHLDALLLSDGLRRLYVAEDDDPAGRRATVSVMSRAEAAGIEAMRLAPTLGDFNDDLRQLGRDALRAALRVQLATEDVEGFWAPRRGSVRAA